MRPWKVSTSPATSPSLQLACFLTVPVLETISTPSYELPRAQKKQWSLEKAQSPWSHCQVSWKRIESSLFCHDLLFWSHSMPWWKICEHFEHPICLNWLFVLSFHEWSLSMVQFFAGHHKDKYTYALEWCHANIDARTQIQIETLWNPCRMTSQGISAASNFSIPPNMECYNVVGIAHISQEQTVNLISSSFLFEYIVLISKAGRNQTLLPYNSIPGRETCQKRDVGYCQAHIRTRSKRCLTVLLSYSMPMFKMLREWIWS